MRPLGQPPVGVVIIIKLVALGSAALGWVFGAVVAFVAFPILPLIMSPGQLFWVWPVSMVLAPIFLFMSARRIKDASWNGLIDPVCALVLGVFSAIGAIAILSAASLFSLA